MPQFDIDAYLANRLGAPNPSKLDEIAQARLEKIRSLNELRRTVATQDPAISRDELHIEGGRSGNEFFADVGLSALQGLDTLAKVPAMAYDKATTGNWYGPETQKISAMSDEREGLKSDFAQASNRIKANLAQKAGEKAKALVGDGAMGTAAQIAAEFGTSFWESLKDPATLPDAIAGQIAQLGVMGKVGRASEMAAQAAAKAAPKIAATKAGQYALEKAGTAGAVTASAGLQGVDSGSDAMQRLMNLPEEVWLTNADYVALAEQVGPEAARQQIASNLATNATLKAAMASLASSAIVPGGNSLEKALLNKQTPGLKTIPKVFAGEATQEGIEEGTGQVAANMAVKEINAAQDLAEGVGTAAGQGAFLGGVMGGGFQAARSAKMPKFDAPVDPDKTKAFEEASKTGDVTALLDPKAKTYDPEAAIRALLNHSSTEGLAPEAKQANLDRAASVIANLQDQKDELDRKLKLTSPEGLQTFVDAEQAKLATLTDPAERAGTEALIGMLQDEIAALKKTPADPREISALTDQMGTLSTRLASAQAALTEFNQETQAAETKDLDVEAEAANITAADPVASQAAANKIINLSMAVPERVDAGLAARLANDQTNGLTAQQRSYLRTFSAARTEANKLKDLSQVSQEIYYGGNGNVGIAQYRANVTSAIAGNNRATAERELRQLGKFVEDHTGKAAAMAQAYALFKQDGQPRMVVSDANRGWSIEMGNELNDDKRATSGTMNINEKSPKVVAEIQVTAKAVSTAFDELRAAVDLKFSTPPASEGTDVKDVSRTEGVQAQPQPQAEATAEAGEQAGSGVDGQGVTEPVVSGEQQAGTGQTDESLGVTEEAPASAVNNAEAAGTETTTVETQSTEETSIDESIESTEATGSGVLAGIQQKSPEGTPFNQRNLLADFFIQSVGAADANSQRPLARVKDFLSQAAQPLVNYLTDKTLTVQQQTAIDQLKTSVKQWSGRIQSNLVRTDKNFWYKDMMQFLLVEQDGKLDLDENVKTAMAYSAFSMIADQGTRNPFNTDEEINAILGRDDDAMVSYKERDVLGTVGTRQNVVVSALGRTAVQALGLKMTKDAPLNLMAQLENALGAHILKMLLDEGILVRTKVPVNVMAELMGNQGASTTADQSFIKVARQANGQLNQQAQTILNAQMGSKNVLDKLFAVEPALKEPSFEPIPFTQKTTKNTDKRVPAKLAKVMEHENSVANFVRQDMWQIATLLGAEVLYTIAGVKPVDDSAVHKANRKSLQAKNDGLVREVDRFMGFVGSMADLAAPMYFEHSVWKQQRVGIATNVINPQTSKVHRHMLYRASWDTEVNLDNEAQMNNFKLRVLEGFGVKTDKQSNDKSLASYDQTVGNPTIQEAVEVLREALYEGGMTEEGQAKIEAAVREGGENFHSLDALLALAHEAQAVRSGQGSFKVQMMGEVDGVTNGPMLSQLMLGAAASVDQLYQMLNRGGFFQQDSGQSNYNTWRDQPGHQDLYEATAAKMIEAVQALIKTDNKLGVALSAVYAFTGDLSAETKESLKKRRNIIKTPLTAMVFGSSVGSAVDSMADSFIESIYASIEEVATSNGTKDVDAVRNNINTLLLLGKGPTLSSMDIDQLMSHEFDDAQVRALKRVFKDTLGKAVDTTMRSGFGTFMFRRTVLNQGAQLAFELYNAAYQGLRAGYIKELVAKGELAVDSKGNPLHDLTGAQEREVRARVAKLQPTLHTFLSKQSSSLAGGLYAAKTGRKLSQDRQYQSQIQFGSVFGDNNAASVRVNAMDTMEENPGVAMVIMGVHSTDSAISHEAADGNEVLNVHDAHGAGLGTFEQTARNLNKATWNAMLNYSLPDEMYQMLSRTMRGTAELLQTNPELAENIRAAVEKLAARLDVVPEAVLDDLVRQMRSVAFQADQIRLQTLAVAGSFDQYALEGGQYVVEDADRQAAQAKQASLVEEMTPAEKQAANKLLEAVLGYSYADENGVLESIAEVGESIWEMDTQLVQSLTNAATDGALTANQTLRVLYDHQSKSTDPKAAFNMKLIKALNRFISKDLEILFVTPGFDKQRLSSIEPRAHGWFTPGKNQAASQVAILGPGFINARVTPELLLHELLHAATAHLLRSKSAQATKAYKQLTELLNKAREVVSTLSAEDQNEFGLSATRNVDELVSWGFTNKGFQNKVLAKVQMDNKGSIISGLQKFIKVLTDLFFADTGLAEEAYINQGMSALILNTFELLADESVTIDENANGINSPSFAMAVPEESPESVDAVGKYTTLDIHQALSGLSNGAVSARFNQHLGNLLTGIVERLHGPFGAFAAEMRKTEASTPMDVWLKALSNGKAPFATQIGAAGMATSSQELFAIEQVEATVKAALDANETVTTQAYRELYKLYTEVSKKLTAQDFIKAGLTEDDYNFVFNMEANLVNRSDYLARFAALGLAHEKFSGLLKFETSTAAPTAGKTVFDRLVNIFDKILSFFNEKLTKTYAGQPADTKLMSLVDTLVDIEAKKRNALKMQQAGGNRYIAAFEKGTKGAVDSVKAKLGEVANTDFVKNSTYGAVQLAGTTVKVLTAGKADAWMDQLRDFSDRQAKKHDGIIMGMLREARGPLDLFKALLLTVKHREQQRKSVITQHARGVVKAFKDAGKYLDKDGKAAISAVLLRTGAHNLLAHFSLAQIENMLSDSSALDVAIAAFEARLTTRLKAQHIEQAKDLGHYKATGENRSTWLMFNAHVIARMMDTQFAGQITEQEAASQEDALKVLITLYSIKDVDNRHLQKASEILRTENLRADGNGVEFTLGLFKQMEAESLEKLFNNNPVQMVHGYTPEITNGHTDVKVATAEQGAELVKQGYVQGVKLGRDSADPNQDDKFLYVQRDGGLMPWMSGVISLTNMRAKGSEVHNGYLNVNTVSGLANAQLQADITETKTKQLARGKGAKYDASKAPSSNLAPIYNENGKVTGWRYLMKEHTKDIILERNNDFDQIIGVMAGGTYDKVTSKVQNERAIMALRQQYEMDRRVSASGYVEVGDKVADPTMRELWDMLPFETKETVRKIWGRDSMLVRIDSVDLIFGYRKLSAADFLRKNTEDLTGISKIAREFFNTYARAIGKTADEADAWAKRLGLTLVKGERGWQEIVHEIKDIIVVKNLTTLLGNIYSNDSLLFLLGVDNRWHHQMVAIKGVMAYQEHTDRLAEIETQLETGYAYADAAELQREATRLKDLIARNPVKPLIDAGLMPTIVEDVETEEDIYSYKSLLNRKLEKYTARIPQAAKEFGKAIYMSHDTKLYKFLSKTTQYSDFVARYALYQHLTTRAENRMSHTDAIIEASDAFVNYDVPMQRNLQWTDDMGFTPFIKYFMRIQRFLFKTAKENPARVLGLAAVDKFMGLGPIVLDSSFVGHLGNNPFTLGALRYPSSLDELLTIKSAMSLVK